MELHLKIEIKWTILSSIRSLVLSMMMVFICILLIKIYLGKDEKTSGIASNKEEYEDKNDDDPEYV